MLLAFMPAFGSVYWFLWVVDFPLLEYSPDDKRWVARHHPFTSPKTEHMEWMINKDEAKFGQLLAKAYDLVCNGYEMGGGSIRIYRNDLQAAMFRTLGFSEEDAQNRFGFFSWKHSNTELLRMVELPGEWTGL